MNADVVTDKEDPGQLNRGLLIVGINPQHDTQEAFMDASRAWLNRGV